jgi:ABC-type antimicrobial peptide transport system permease subunit
VPFFAEFHRTIIDSLVGGQEPEDLCVIDNNISLDSCQIIASEHCNFLNFYNTIDNTFLIMLHLVILFMIMIIYILFLVFRLKISVILMFMVVYRMIVHLMWKKLCIIVSMMAFIIVFIVILWLKKWLKVKIFLMLN